MSTFEHLFLDPEDRDLESAVSRLIGALRFEVDAMAGSSGRTYVYCEQVSSSVGHVGGAFERNVYGDMGPESPAEVTGTDFAIYDDMPFVWSLWAADGRQKTSLDEQQRRARAVFDLVVGRLGWSAMLVHEFDALVATYDPGRGVREFPPGTPADGTGRHLWG